MRNGSSNRSRPFANLKHIPLSANKLHSKHRSAASQMDLTVNVILENFPLQPLDSKDSDRTSRTETLEQGEEDEEDEEALSTKEDEAFIAIQPVDDSPLDNGQGTNSSTKKAAAYVTVSWWKKIFTTVATLIAYMFLTAGISMIAPFYPIVVSCIRSFSPGPKSNTV